MYILTPTRRLINPEVRELTPIADRASQCVDLWLDSDAVEKPLGVKWDVTSDSLTYEPINDVKTHIRRGILSAVSSLFDPLGLLAPIILPAKKLLQQLNQRGLDWDQSINDEELNIWNKWLMSLTNIGSVMINRCICQTNMNSECRFQQHHFSDASPSGYGAVSYLRTIDSLGNINCSILLTTKVVTIPRIELTAATIAVRLDVMLKYELDIDILKTYFWTDSTAVFQYISNEKRRYQTFVANRVTFIREYSSLSEWHHVSTVPGLSPKDPELKKEITTHLTFRLNLALLKQPLTAALCGKNS